MKISFITIPTAILEQSIKFYQDVLDFELERRFQAGAETEIAFLSDKHHGKVELIDRGTEPPAVQSPVSIGFEVDDINQTREHLESHQVEIVSGPTVMPSGVKLLHAKDPNGVALGFVEYGK